MASAAAAGADGIGEDPGREGAVSQERGSGGGGVAPHSGLGAHAGFGYILPRLDRALLPLPPSSTPGLTHTPLAPQDWDPQPRPPPLPQG